MREQSPVLAVVELFNGRKKLRFSLWAEAFDAPNKALFAGGFEIIDAFDTQTVMERDNLLQSQTRNLVEIDDPRRQLAAQLLQHRAFPGAVSFFDDGRQSLADTIDLRQT